MANETSTRRRVDKVVQLVASSSTSWEHAAQLAVTEASKTIRELTAARVLEKDVLLREGTTLFRVKLEMAFQIDRSRLDAAGVPVEVRRYLILANQTLASPRLHQLIHERVARGSAEFHVLVPHSATPVIHTDPSGLVDPTAHHAVFESQRLARRQAQRRLDSFFEELPELGTTLTGEVASADPLSAARHVMARSSFDEIIVSTLPSGISKWLKLDLPSRVERAFGLPVTALVQDGSPTQVG